MNNALDGKVALVTGGGRGIGAAVAMRLAREGADVALTYQQNQHRADEVVDQIKAAGRRAVAIRADSSDTAAVVAAVDQVTGSWAGWTSWSTTPARSCSDRWSS